MELSSKLKSLIVDLKVDSVEMVIKAAYEVDFEVD